MRAARLRTKQAELKDKAATGAGELEAGSCPPGEGPEWINTLALHNQLPGILYDLLESLESG